MPSTSKKKSSSKKSTKKTTAKRSSSKKSTSKSRATATSQKHPIHHHYLAKAQEEFHSKHPNANSLIATFILTFGVLVILYVSKTY